jgi:SAM-dependent methyltransferase
VVFPRLLDWSMRGNSEMSDLRREVLAPVFGDVFEIGFGTGLNLEHYPSAVKSLSVAEPNSGMQRFAKPRCTRVKFPIRSVQASGESLPFPDRAFDWAVSTWTLCSVSSVEKALAEITRVLKPGGRLVFLEHGLSPDPKMARRQAWLNPINGWIADGCSLNRPLRDLVDQSSLSLESCDEFQMRSVPRTHGYMFRGIAVKSAIG